MKRICNYLQFKISTTKLFIFSALLVIYQFSLLLNLISSSHKYNIYDFIINNFSYLSLFYSIDLFFLVIIYNIFDKKNFYNYLNTRFSSKQEVYRANVLSAFVFSIGIVVFINIICIIMGSFMSFVNSWSPYFFYTMTGKVNLSYDNEVIKLITQEITPILLVLITSFLTMLYLFFISMFFIVCNIIFKKRAVSFALVIILNALSMAFDAGNLSRFSFTNNIYIMNSRVNEVTNGTYIISKLAYWFILIVLIYIIGNKLTKKKDCSYGE
ncbi:hypothetical protein Sgly_0832 [Syntrophobotulus glycolicus DSM 8271]|uniref:Uncharacterized protein n=1 Tax=Syntrophobotulus glycolicus (strain DSM 8271 / FlGlyR) TaxID=645991 RepID=F0T1B9_SYNGF|nr:hypothetical protein Sgly_0832 [Syntrophobotulus glycolicus DSM 8271]